mmetsp:Transcript_17636/g.29316  ORF Transcript_17636/g.29316 Transcript_17636/m.29316 type:complete len:214 (-) Transcript_17636:258-899(-)
MHPHKQDKNRKNASRQHDTNAAITGLKLQPALGSDKSLLESSAQSWRRRQPIAPHNAIDKPLNTPIGQKRRRHWCNDLPLEPFGDGHQHLVGLNVVIGQTQHTDELLPGLWRSATERGIAAASAGWIEPLLNPRKTSVAHPRPGLAREALRCGHLGNLMHDVAQSRPLAGIIMYGNNLELLCFRRKQHDQDTAPVLLGLGGSGRWEADVSFSR